MKPILFNTEMVRAILDRRKTQTRRVFSSAQEKYFDAAIKLGEIRPIELWGSGDFKYIIDFSKYKKGDILYVRETFAVVDDLGYEKIKKEVESDCVMFKTDFNSDEINKWKPSIHMQKEYARIFLKVTDVRVERLKDMVGNDIEAEGIILNDYEKFEFYPHQGMKDWINLWNSTSKDGYKWEDNPYVFVYEFERIDKDKS